MFSLRRWQMLLLSAALLTTPAWAARSHRTPTAHRHYRHHHRAVHHHVLGQRAMAADRVTQIQTALIHDHYLTGDANGVWDSKTQAAMRSYQSDHGWQTRLMPDARALIALGLGPKTDEAHVQNTKKTLQPQPTIAAADTLADVQIIAK